MAVGQKSPFRSRRMDCPRVLTVNSSIVLSWLCHLRLDPYYWCRHPLQPVQALEMALMLFKTMLICGRISCVLMVEHSKAMLPNPTILLCHRQQQPQDSLERLVTPSPWCVSCQIPPRGDKSSWTPQTGAEKGSQSHGSLKRFNVTLERSLLSKQARQHLPFGHFHPHSCQLKIWLSKCRKEANWMENSFQIQVKFSKSYAESWDRK